jgi:hypothetical protein
MAALLKSLFKLGLISEDVYHHSLDNLPRAIGFDGGLECSSVKAGREVEAGGRV